MPIAAKHITTITIIENTMIFRENLFLRKFSLESFRETPQNPQKSASDNISLPQLGHFLLIQPPRTMFLHLNYRIRPSDNL